MKKIIILLMVVGMFVAAIPAQAEEEQKNTSKWERNFNFFLGSKVLNEDEWAPMDEHAELGFQFDMKRPQWPVSFAIDLLGSATEETVGATDYETATSEFNIGIRKIFKPTTHARPFIGGGLSLMSVEERAKTAGVTTIEEDSGTGFWVSGGLYWTLSGRFNLGFEAKVSSADVTIGGQEVDAGGTHFGLLLGFHW